MIHISLITYMYENDKIKHPLSANSKSFTKCIKSNQGNQVYSGNQNNVIQGQRHEKTDIHNKEYKVTKLIQTK